MNHSLAEATGVGAGLIAGLWTGFGVFHMFPWRSDSFMWWYFPELSSVIALGIAVGIGVSVVVEKVLKKL